ncbi:flagellar motor protein MotB [Azospirillum sp.]|uniref:flagellar motor protein MotB n=1 Tax=Azospirillum sp. TaxID=34012 RepID=UPI003D74A6C3
MIRVPKPVPPDAQGAAARKTIWLISFTDLMSLLLAFFVLMFSMSEPQVQRWTKMAQGLSARSTATRPSDAQPVPAAAFNAATIETESAINLDYLGALLHGQVAESAELTGVQVVREDDRVVIGLPGEVLFEKNAPMFSPRGRRVLYLLGAVVGRIGNRIEVVGHAEREDVPAEQAWERSLGRAVAVSMALREHGYRRELVARTAMGRLLRTDIAGPRVDIVVRETKE